MKRSSIETADFHQNQGKILSDEEQRQRYKQISTIDVEINNPLDNERSVYFKSPEMIGDKKKRIEFCD